MDLSIMDSWSNELAWLLGWALTDASIENKSRFVVAWQLKDLEPLQIFQRLFKTKKNIEFCKRKQGDYYRLRLCGKEIVDKFVSFGIIPNKSLIVNMPEMPTVFLSHFVRGVLEGDGSIVWRRPSNDYKEDYLSCTVSICSGSWQFINKLHTYFEYGRLSDKKSSGVYRLNFYSSNASKFLSYIYQDSEGIRLTRKYERYIGVK